MRPVSLEPTAARSWSQRARALLGRRSEFNRNIAKLSGGTVLRTLIVFGTMPVVTRLYTPQDFGDLQLLLSVMAAFAGVSTLKYELAIVLPREREQSQAVMVLCLCAVGLLGLTLGLLTWQFAPWFLALFDATRLEPWAGLVVIGFLAMGILRTAQYALVASKEFGSLARNTVVQVGCSQGSYMGLGAWHPTFLGLFASQMLGYAVAIVLALRRAPIRLRGIRVATLLELARRYRKFPLVNAPGVFVNSVAFEMPVFLLARYFDAEVVGYYMLTERLLGQPTTLVGEAIGKVYLQSAAEARYRSALELRGLFRSTAARLLAVSLPFALAVLVAAPWATELVLGDRYREVGVLMQILIFGSCMQFVASPLIVTFSVVNRQEIGMSLMVLSSLVRLGAMLAFSGSAHSMLGALAAAQAVFGVTFVLVIDRALTREARAEARRARLGGGA